MTTESSIEVRGLSKRFGAFVALDDVSFVYRGNRVVGYLGPNGAGKTTTLKLLTNLLRPSSGVALINGIEVARDPRRALQQVGALIETPEPYPALRARDALSMVGEFRGVRGDRLDRRIKELSAELDLPPLDRRIGALSKGQRQRVVIASTLIADPGILILDEPTSGLDPEERVRIRNLVLQLKKDHLILMSSHLLGEVSDTCDDVIIVDKGRVLLKDSVEAIQARRRSDVVEVIFEHPIPDDAIRSLGDLVDRVETVAPGKYQLHFDGSASVRDQILDRLRTIGPVVSFSAVGSALEDAYLKLLVESTPNSGGRGAAEQDGQIPA